MSQPTIVVIDDSNTIRRLVDSHLSQAGYRVILAPNAEDGIRLVAEHRPDLILLDHQLPGTTGFEVCQQLLAADELRSIPVVVSSTLRKKAYAEYTELPNVVDMLPKPYTPELLNTTVSNALDTGKLIVQSQSQGTAVPETIDDPEETALSGNFAAFALREVLDFLNNSCKAGMLEVESQQGRVRFYLRDGRIQGVTASGIDPQCITANLPDTLRELRPVLKFTLGGRGCSEVDGLVELLDNKVLDPRLLRSLLRHQAAVLTHLCFATQLKCFRFEAGTAAPPLIQRLPLEISQLALLIDGSLLEDAGTSFAASDHLIFVRKAIRGQNLDRAGLSAKHMKLLGCVSEPVGFAELTQRLGWPAEELRGVLSAMMLAELVESQSRNTSRTVVALERDAAAATTLQKVFHRHQQDFNGRVVRDELALKLLLRRTDPDVIVLSVDSDTSGQFAAELRSSGGPTLNAARWIGIGSEANADDFDLTLPEGVEESQVIDAIFQALSSNRDPLPTGDSAEAEPVLAASTH